MPEAKGLLSVVNTVRARSEVDRGGRCAASWCWGAPGVALGPRGASLSALRVIKVGFIDVVRVGVQKYALCVLLHAIHESLAPPVFRLELALRVLA